MLLFGLPIRLIGAVFALVVHTYLIYSAWAKVFSRLRFFCAFSGFFFTSVCLFACAFRLSSLASVWPNFFFDFASFLSSFSKLVYCFRGFLLAVAGTLVEQLVLLLFSFWNLLESFGLKQRDWTNAQRWPHLRSHCHAML